MENGAQDQNYDFNPIDFDVNNIEPEAAAGQYTAHIEEIKIAKSGEGWPQARVEWMLDAAQTDSEECEKSVGATITDFITFRPEGDKKGNFAKQTLRRLLTLLGLDTDIIPTRMERKEDFDNFVESAKGVTDVTVYVTLQKDRDDPNLMRARVSYTAPRSMMGPVSGTETEEEVEAEAAPPPPRKPAARPAPPKPAARKPAPKPAKKASARR